MTTTPSPMTTEEEAKVRAYLSGKDPQLTTLAKAGIIPHASLQPLHNRILSTLDHLRAQHAAEMAVVVGAAAEAHHLIDEVLGDTDPAEEENPLLKAAQLLAPFVGDQPDVSASAAALLERQRRLVNLLTHVHHEVASLEDFDAASLMKEIEQAISGEKQFNDNIALHAALATAETDLTEMAERVKKAAAENVALLERLREAEEDFAKEERDHENTMAERDYAQDALQQAHINLGGDGEWVGKTHPELAPDSGDLHLDVPELAAEVKAERDAAVRRAAELLECLRGHVLGTSFHDDGTPAQHSCCNCRSKWKPDEPETHKPTCILNPSPAAPEGENL